ncbi:MAG: GNAT family N-acetyltransferase [Ardenticatenales bacterium]|nr:GNAT family N-acetyltransferase [Ardenticatenales bacterium]
MLLMDFALAERLEMSEMLRQAAYPELLNALEPEAEAALEEVAGGYAIALGGAFPLNRALGLGMAREVDEEDLEQVEAFYRLRGLPAEIELCPLADSSLMMEVAARRYSVLRFSNFFVRPLHWDEEGESWSEEIRIEEVTALDDWAWASTWATSGEEVESDDTTFLLDRIAARRPGVRLFLAWIDDTPAGASALFVHEGLATLFSTSTHPAFRGRGAQHALLEARLSVARAEGCDLALVTTLPGSASQRNIMRAGFQVAYTKPIVRLDLE